MARQKRAYDDLKGVSARMIDEDLESLRLLMKRYKDMHYAGFSVGDLLKTVITMPQDILDAQIERFVGDSKNDNQKILKKLNVSDDAKARIAAILAEEAAKKA